MLSRNSCSATKTPAERMCRKWRDDLTNPVRLDEVEAPDEAAAIETARAPHSTAFPYLFWLFAP
jgi:hypothetical protein